MRWKALVIAGVSVLGSVFGAGAFVGSRWFPSIVVPEEKPLPSRRPVPVHPAWMIKMSAAEIAEKYASSPEDADKQLKNTVVEVSGVVGSTGKLIEGDPWIALNGGWPQVTCVLPRTDEAQVNALSPGQQIAFRGKPRFLHPPEIFLLECTIVP